MSSALCVVKKGGKHKMPAINKGRRPYSYYAILAFFKKVRIFKFQGSWCSFWRNFLITPINSTSTQFCL